MCTSPHLATGFALLSTWLKSQAKKEGDSMPELPRKSPTELRQKIERQLKKMLPRQQAITVAYAKGLHAGYRLAFDILRRQQER